MSAIILFRFHRAYDVCEQTLRLLRKLNPDIAIHGLYGGNDSLDSLPHHVTKYMDTIWTMPLDDPHYKWMNGDLCARRWFKDHGCTIGFEHAYFLEWDQLFVKPLYEVYGPLERNTNYGTIFGDYAHTQESGWYWTKGQFGFQTRKLIKHLQKRDLPVAMEKLSFSIMGGGVFCRKFLEKYIEQPVPSYSNDEVRFSFYSYAFDIPLKDNDIWKRMKQGKNVYNAEDEELSEKDLEVVLKNGGDVLHPLRMIIENVDEKIGV